jgi:hypothetical protein
MTLLEPTQRLRTPQHEDDRVVITLRREIWLARQLLVSGACHSQAGLDETGITKTALSEVISARMSGRTFGFAAGACR